MFTLFRRRLSFILIKYISENNYSSFIYNLKDSTGQLIGVFMSTIIEINYWTNGKICAKVAFPRVTESVQFRSQSRETASKRKPYRELDTR